MKGLLKKKCAQCKKEFYPPSTDWVYKVETGSKTYKYLCSWSCYRKKANKND